MTLPKLFWITLLASALIYPASVGAQQCDGENVKPNSTVQELIQDLSSDYWPRVWNAALRLESHQAEAIPALLELTKSDKYVKLSETWDLIYPGAKTFYGHGFIVDYDIDWISARAGWVLENLTFENFRFSEGVLDHDSLRRATVAGMADQPIENVVKLKKDQNQQKSRMAAVDRAAAWWKHQGPAWNRSYALVEALKSEDPVRVSRAMNWVRNGKTRCDGFNRGFVESKVLPISGTYISPELDEFRNWLRDMEKEGKDLYFYNAKNQDACY